MMWSQAPYPLKGVYSSRGVPMEAEGPTAAACRCLDDFDPMGPSEENTLTDMQTGRELLHWLDGWRWCPELGMVVVPDGDMLRALPKEDVARKVGEYIQGRAVWAKDQCRRAKASEDPEWEKAAKAYLKFAEAQATAANESRQTARLLNSSMPRVAAAALDADPWVLGTPDGVVDLATGTLLEDRRHWLQAAGIDAVPTAHDVTKRTGGRLDNAAERREYPYDRRWDEFIGEIMGGDAEKAAFFQRALGYSLLGSNPEKATFVLHGPGRNNGKSTALNAVKNAMGDYACSTDVGIVLEQRFRNPGAASPEVAKLVGKRLVDLPEPPAGSRLDSSKVKLYASGTDSVTARFLNRDSFEFVPAFTLWMHCNALPVVDDPSAINSGNMFVIEFTESFSGESRDVNLAERFSTETGKHTVLCWLLAGLSMYLREGLDPPDCVREATQAWERNSGTWLDRFLAERCRLGTGSRVPVSELKAAMQAYCEAEGEEMMTMRAVNRYLAQFNVASRNSHNTRYYVGIGLLEGEIAAESRTEKCTQGAGELRLA